MPSSMATWAAVVGLVLAPSAAQAHDACAESFSWPAVGRWAEFEGTDNTNNPITSRYAVLAIEHRGGTEFKWIELKVHDEKKHQAIIYQMLVPGTPLDVDRVEEIVMKMAEQPAMKISGVMMGMIRGQLSNNSAFKTAGTEARLVGEEKITVPAGTFSTRRFHTGTNDSDTWVDRKRQFSMVKSVGKTYETVLPGPVRGPGTRSPRRRDNRAASRSSCRNYWRVATRRRRPPSGVLAATAYLRWSSRCHICRQPYPD